jgi:hypothetical protein
MAKTFGATQRLLTPFKSAQADSKVDTEAMMCSLGHTVGYCRPAKYGVLADREARAPSVWFNLRGRP